MDSLLSSYASSDDEESSPLQKPHKPINQPNIIEQNLQNPISKPPKFSLPPPKSSNSAHFEAPHLSKSNLFEPYQPKQENSYSENNDNEVNQEKSNIYSFFSSIPQPKAAKTLVPDPQHTVNPLSGTSAKRVVQFRPPVNFLAVKSNNVDEEEEEEEDDEEKERKRKKAEFDLETPSVRSFLSSIPAPRNSVSLGILGSGLGTGRKAVIDADVQDLGLGSGNLESEVGVSGSEGKVPGGGESEYGNIGDYSSWGSKTENDANFDCYSGYIEGEGNGNVEDSSSIAASGEYLSSGNEYGNYGSCGQYENNWTEGSSTLAMPEVAIERALRLPAKRGRKDDPLQIIEVNQDELMKNRPREDQTKMTGIAFGPAYQPASSKGKPSKLHKRKHQIGALYFDMKQKETELAERRSKGFLTKAQTQGKYGW